MLPRSVSWQGQAARAPQLHQEHLVHWPWFLTAFSSIRNQCFSEKWLILWLWQGARSARKSMRDRERRGKGEGKGEDRVREGKGREKKRKQKPDSHWLSPEKTATAVLCWRVLSWCAATGVTLTSVVFLPWTQWPQSRCEKTSDSAEGRSTKCLTSTRTNCQGRENTECPRNSHSLEGPKEIRRRNVMCPGWDPGTGKGH